ncbi:hypothetical protein A2554_00325 [Candidatus Nomurabacteria bacterium RIFOXYD2_FULL_35_12]|uniref:Uncharacterized protein n=1 Tax=Candidatus Nomurabacteria bacterium RIFOXYA1_FULL_35_17 TaxID=1801798 RepID=A0A1F6YKI2_9BACT|nr:MAG: hypothetical protein A2192_01195 [Candidatus Nomurabacteria bacterium RIFOXYA1_FULL_35_17]OGJ14829.1 MAG: hypothetical protein A2554_00325 [Candidatus Nomurabacteria bacterium RIFOXYD2_FULL_35_12]
MAYFTIPNRVVGQEVSIRGIMRTENRDWFGLKFGDFIAIFLANGSGFSSLLNEELKKSKSLTDAFFNN